MAAPVQKLLAVPPSERVEQQFRRLEPQWSADTRFLSDPGVTFFGVFLTPVFFYLLRRHSDRAEVAVQRRE
jgi:hypothetical protein